MVSICAVTMVYNEPDFLPLWISHYATQVGAGKLYVIDHGSDDGSTQERPGVSFIRLPRTPHDDTKRAALVGSIVAMLLAIHDVVLHTDVDEMVFADPRAYPSLAAYAAASPYKAEHALGFDVLHIRDIEPPLLPGQPVLAQRRWVRFNSAMCKPVLVRKQLSWAPGFHCSNEAVLFGSLYLLHLRWFDYDMALKRLARSRAQSWADPKAGAWQRLPDAAYAAIFADYAAIPRLEDCAFLPDQPPLAAALDRLLLSQIGRERETYKFELDISLPMLLPLPPSFRTVL